MSCWGGCLTQVTRKGFIPLLNVQLSQMISSILAVDGSQTGTSWICHGLTREVTRRSTLISSRTLTTWLMWSRRLWVGSEMSPAIKKALFIRPWWRETTQSIWEKLRTLNLKNSLQKIRNQSFKRPMPGPMPSACLFTTWVMFTSHFIASPESTNNSQWVIREATCSLCQITMSQLIFMLSGTPCCTSTTRVQNCPSLLIPGPRMAPSLRTFSLAMPTSPSQPP